jgi:hypothetical protein
MNDVIDDLNRLREDWTRSGGEAPQVELASIRRRLSRRWVLAAFELLLVGGVLALLILTAMDMHGPMEWIYWSFFAAYFVGFSVFGLRARLEALGRDGDGTPEILDHAWRDAKVREVGGLAALFGAPAVWLFASFWMIADGLLEGQTLAGFITERWFPFLFVTVVCVFGAVIGLLTRERGRRQRLQLKRLADELCEGEGER